MLPGIVVVIASMHPARRLVVDVRFFWFALSLAHYCRLCIVGGGPSFARRGSPQWCSLQGAAKHSALGSSSSLEDIIMCQCQ